MKRWSPIQGAFQTRGMAYTRNLRDELRGGSYSQAKQVGFNLCATGNLWRVQVPGRERGKRSAPGGGNSVFTGQADGTQMTSRRHRLYATTITQTQHWEVCYNYLSSVFSPSCNILTQWSSMDYFHHLGSIGANLSPFLLRAMCTLMPTLMFVCTLPNFLSFTAVCVMG